MVDLATGQFTGPGRTSVTFLSVESVRGSPQADTLIGDAGSNRLEGFGGDDHIEGRGGDDFLDGGTGNDFLDGSNGIDKCLNGETVLNCEA